MSFCGIGVARSAMLLLVIHCEMLKTMFILIKHEIH